MNWNNKESVKQGIEEAKTWQTRNAEAVSILTLEKTALEDEYEAISQVIQRADPILIEWEGEISNFKSSHDPIEMKHKSEGYYIKHVKLWYDELADRFQKEADAMDQFIVDCRSTQQAIHTKIEEKVEKITFSNNEITRWEGEQMRRQRRYNDLVQKEKDEQKKAEEKRKQEEERKKNG